MATLRFDNTVAGWAQINALPSPKYPIISGARVTVLTGSDIPPEAASADPSSIVLTTRQLMQGADAIARARLQAIEGYIRGIVGVDAKDPADQIAPTGTYAQIKFWKWDNKTIRRTDPEINAMRVALGWNAALMDSIFVAGSGMDP
jgi:hypothetical protein